MERSPRTKEVLIFALVVFATQISHGLSGSATVPAFLWSSHNLGSSQNSVKEFVNYCTMSPEELVDSVLSDGGWSKFLCPHKVLQQNVDVALVFVGRKLKSSDMSKPSNVESALVDYLKHSFTSSNFSMAFPYIAKSDEEAALENSIMSAFLQNCGHDLEVNHIAYSDACLVDDERFTKFSDLQSIQDHLNSKKEKKTDGQTDLIVFCEDSQDSGHVKSEGETLSKLGNFLEELGARYTVLYASDPFKTLQNPAHKSLDRFLLEGSHGSGSSNSTYCDGVCQIKSSILEGVFVGITLLIILLSGLCCMMGIDTPSRFETPQE